MIRVRPVHWQLNGGSERRSLVHFLDVDDWSDYDGNLMLVCGVNRASLSLLDDPESGDELCCNCLRRLGALGKRNTVQLEDGRQPLQSGPTGRAVLVAGPYGLDPDEESLSAKIGPRLRPSLLAHA